MKLKISGNTKEQFKKNTIDFLNLSTLICLKGSIPSNYDIETAERLGRWWIKEPDNKRFSLLGVFNNDWIHIIEEAETYMVVEFHFRYDTYFQKELTISQLMNAWLDFVEII